MTPPASSHLLEAGLAASGIGVWAWELASGQLHWSPAQYALFGLAADETIDLERWSSFVHPDDRAALGRLMEAVQAGATAAVQTEFRIVTAAGERWILATGQLQRGPDGAVLHGVNLDVTARKRAEFEAQAAQQQQRRLEQGVLDERRRLGIALRAGRMGVYEWRVDAGALWWSPEIYDVFGQSAAQFTPTLDGFSALVHADDRAALWRKTEVALAEGRGFEHEFRIVRPTGEVRWVLNLAQVSLDAAGAALFTGIAQDITERKEVEHALARSEAQFRDLADAMPQIVFVTRPDGSHEYLNAQWQRVTGEPTADDATVARLLHPDDAAAMAATWPARRARGEPYTGEFRLRCQPDGRYRWFLARAVPIRDAHGAVVRWYGTSTDIDDLKEAERRLQDSEHLFRTIGEAVPDFLWMSDGAGRPLYQNPAWRRYTGLASHELEAQGWQSLHPADDLARLQVVWNDAMTRGQPYEIECRIRRHDGAYRWFSARAVPVRAADGAIGRWIGTLTDIHDLKQAEAALREADRRKDEFLATLAHELRNPLAPISNGLRLLAGAGADAALTARVLAMMQRQVGQMVRLVDDLLEVSRITRGKIELRPVPVDLSAVVQDALDAVRPTIEAARHRLEVRLPPAPLTLVADPVRLAQVLVNLLNNAAKYTDDGGQIALTAHVADHQLELEVRDNGSGIPPAMLPRVFELFTQVDRTLGRAQGGLGIGLALVRRLVELHGGTVHAASEGPGQGSVFVVRLPLAPALADAAVAPAAPAAAERLAGLRVLVVDDHIDAADSLALVLQGTGAQVRTAYDGRAALQIAAGFDPQAAVIDLGMPDMDGCAVAAALRAQAAGAPPWLAALTGWGQDADRQRALAAGFDVHLTKPTDLDALVDTLQRVRAGRWPAARRP